MATTVDERIVAAKFDASDFEKGVNKTIKKLDELKQSLNMEAATNSIKDLSDKASKSAESMGNSLEKLSNRFTSFTGMIKQSLLTGLADQVAGVFLRMEQSVLGFVRSIGSQQVSVGMSKYTEILNSVRTMTSAGKDEEQSYEAIKRLGEYSDQTSYSLNQMTTALSQFVAAGVKQLDGISQIETAERMVEGLANMAASAGVNIYDAQRAFTNFSQAYSSGTMRITDWMSLESLHMASEDIMKVFMEAGEKAGTLVSSLDKDGNKIYKTMNNINKAVQGGKTVGTQGFRNTLAYGWLDKETMKYATAMLSYFEDLQVDLDSLSDEQLKEFSTRAFQAAKEARSFADVIGTLKDVVATGWATTFEGLFGKLSEATAFFTELSDDRSPLANSIYRISSWRNAVLDAFNTLDAEGQGAGGRAFRESILNITGALGTLILTFEDLFGIVDPEDEKGGAMIESLGVKLKEAAWGFKDFSNKVLRAANDFRDWMNEPVMKDGSSRLEVLRGALSKIASVFGIVGTAISTAFTVVENNKDTLYGLFDSFINFAGNVGETVTALEPVTKFLGEIVGFLGEVGTFFLGLSIDSVSYSLGFFGDVLGLIIEKLGGNSIQKLRDGEGVLGQITKDFEGIKTACTDGLNAVKTFFAALLDDIRKLLGLGVDGNEGGFFDNVANFFKTNEFVQNVKAWFNKAIKDVSNFIAKIPGKIGKLPSLIGQFFHSLFYKKTMRYNGSMLEEMEVPTELKKWLDQAIKDTQEFIAKIPSFLASIPSLVTEFIHGLFYTKTMRYNGSMLEETEVPTALNEWFTNAKEKAIEFITGLPGKITSFISTVGSVVGTFINELLWVHEEDASGNKVKTDVPTAFGEWLEGAKNDATTFITKTLPNGIREVLGNGIGLVQRFIYGLVLENDKATTSKFFNFAKGVKVRMGLVNWLSQAVETAKTFITETIPNAVKSIPSIITRFVYGLLSEDDHPTNSRFFNFAKEVKVRRELANWLTEAVSYAKTFIMEDLPKGVEDALKSGAGILQRFIHGLFWQPEKDDQGNETGEEVPSALSDWLTNAVADANKFITEELPDRVREVPSLIKAFFDELVKSPEQKMFEQKEKEITASYTDAFGNIINPKEYEEALEAAKKKIEEKKQGFNLWESILSIGGSIKDAFANLAPDIIGGLNSAFEWLAGKIAEATEWLNTNHQKGESITDAITRHIEDENTSDEDKGLFTAIQNIGQTIFDFITKTIPAFISAAVDEVKLQVPKLLGGLFGNNDAGMDKESITRSLGGLFGFGADGQSPAAAAEEAIQEAVNSLENLDDVKEELIDRKKLIEELKNIYNDLEYHEVGTAGKDTLKYTKLGKSNYWTYDPSNYEDIKKWREDQATLKKEIEALEKSKEDLVKKSDFVETDIGPNYEKKAENTKTAINTIGDIMGGFTDILNKVSESDTLKTVAICVAIAIVFTKLSDVLSIADEIESIGYDAKWLAIQTAITGLVALVGWITYLSQDISDEGTKKWERTIQTLEKVGNFVTSLTGIINSIVIALAVKESAGTIGDLFGNGDGTTWYGTVISNLLTRLGELGLVAVGSDLISNSLESLFDGLSEVFTMIGESVDGMLGYLGPAITSLSELYDKMEPAISVIEQIGVLISKFYESIDLTATIDGLPGNANNANLKVSSAALDTNEFKEALDKRIELISQVATMMKHFSESLKTFETINNPSAEIVRMNQVVTLDSFGQFVSKAFKAIYSGLTTYSNRELPNIEDVSYGFNILGETMSIFANGISGLTTDNVEAAKQVLTTVTEIAKLFTDAGGERSVLAKTILGDNSLSKFGKEIKIFGQRIKEFFTNINPIKESLKSSYGDNLDENSIRVVGIVVNVVEGFANAASKMTDDMSMSKFQKLSDQIVEFAPKINEFITNFINGFTVDINEVNLNKLNYGLKVVEIIEKIANAMSLYSKTNLVTWTFDFKSAYNDEFRGFIETLTGNTDIIAGFAESLSGAIEEAFAEDETGALQPKIELRPVISFDQAYLDQQLATNGLNLDGGTINFDMAALVAAVAGANATTEQPVHDYTNQLDTINSSINAIAGNAATAGDLASAFGGMSIFLDTGKLAGAIYNEIDDLIGQKIAYIIRGNAV